MAYLRNNLIARRGYSGFGAWTDTVKDLGKGALSFFGAQQRATGAQEALAQQNRDLIAAQQAQQGGISTTAVLVVGGVALAAVFLLKKKKAAT